METVFFWPGTLIGTPQRRTGHDPTGILQPFVNLLIQYSRGAAFYQEPCVSCWRGYSKIFCFTNWAMYFQVPTRHGIKPLVASCLSTTQRVQAYAADTLSPWAPASTLQSAWGHCRENKNKMKDKTTRSQRHGLLCFFTARKKWGWLGSASSCSSRGSCPSHGC